LLCISANVDNDLENGKDSVYNVNMSPEVDNYFKNRLDLIAIILSIVMR
jgi:hypothetical protein